MKTKKYFLSTWCIANIIQPCLYLLWLRIEHIDAEIETAFESMLMGFVFSGPALCFCVFLWKPLKAAVLNSKVKFAVWLVISVLSVPATIFPLFILMNDVPVFFQLYPMLLPGCVAAVVTVGLRCKKFYFLINQTKSYETNLV